jgi:uncharacterized metal-binding protein YceD (DUF177 family)
MSDNEFSRLVRLDTLGGAPRTLSLAAESGERAALAERFGLLALDRLEVSADVRREGSTVLAEGRVRADVVQACVATDVAVPSAIDAPFALRFVPEAEVGAAEEIELSETDCDTVGYAGGAVDLGEAAAETLALALDPYPRSPRAEAALREAGVISEEEARKLAEESGPFGGLAALRDKLGEQR